MKRHESKIVKEAIKFAKRIGIAPANLMTPTILAEEARNLHKKLDVEVLGELQMKALKMGLILGVSQGSDEQAQFIKIEYKGGKKDEAPTVLIGKGLTFDMGGNSIKPARNLHQMKFDMLGSANVMAAMLAVANLKLKQNIVALVPSSENLINGRATKPGDVHTSMSGITVDIRNTDAEGRLILADALTYAQTYFPNAKSLTTVATLTGAQLYATGKTHSALMGNNQTEIDAMFKAGEQSKDLCWPLPYHKDHTKVMQGEEGVSDLINSEGVPGPGTMTAFAFLNEFVDADMPYTHLDVASTASEGEEVTGRPTKLLVQYLINKES